MGLPHGLVNAALFAVSRLLRESDGLSTWLSPALTWIGVLAAGFGGRLGGEPVERLGISVEADAHPDAPNSVRQSSLPGRSKINRSSSGRFLAVAGRDGRGSQEVNAWNLMG